MTAATGENAVVRQILLEIEIAAPRDRVWQALVEETGRWWHPDFFTGPDAVAFRIEPRLGGWMYEDWGDGEGTIWGTVIGLRAAEFLEVAGDSTPEWGGPNRGLMRWDLACSQEAPAVTTLRFRHAVHGHISSDTLGSLDRGWKLLFGECLKRHVETEQRQSGPPKPAAS